MSQETPGRNFVILPDPRVHGDPNPTGFGARLEPGDPHPPFGRPAAYRFAGFDPQIDVDSTTGRLWPGPAGFEAKHIVRIYPPRALIYAGHRVSRVTCHAQVAPFLRAALAEIDQAGKWHAIEQYGGGFEPRLIRGGTDWSIHTLGLAWDFDPERNPLGAEPEACYFGSNPDGRWVVDCFNAWGFFWGGRFKGRPDPMHFQFSTGV